MESGDDEALHCRGEKWTEPQFRQSGVEQLVVCPVASPARRHASLPLKFLQRLIKGQNGVSRRGIAKLAVTIEALELLQQIQAQAPRAARARHEQVAPAKHKTEARNSFQALVGRGNEEVDAAVRKVDWNRAEAA